MADVEDSLDIGLKLIRGDLDRIAEAVNKAPGRVMEMGESIAVVRYVGALVDAQKADIAASREAEKDAARMGPAEILAKMRELVGSKELLDRDEDRPVDEKPAKGKHK